MEPLEGRRLLSGGGGGGGEGGVFVTQTNLVSDGAVPANNTDMNDLKNSWGIAYGPNTPFWISDNGTSQATLYDAAGVKQMLKVPIPGDGGQPSAPTGQVFNSLGGANEFQVTGSKGTGKALFIFAGEDGGISAWAPNTDPANNAILEVKQAARGSVFKGLAMGTAGGKALIYATDFHNGAVDAFDGTWTAVNLGASAFQDKHIPAGFAPFGIQNLNGNIYVTYAKQKAPDNHDDQSGPGNGYVDEYDTSGNLLQRFDHVRALNSPWGLAIAPASFGRFAGDVLVGQFGSGQIAAFNSDGDFRGLLRTADHKPLVIDGLWAITPGGGGAKNGDVNTLFFTAGPNSEANGLFGSLTATVKKHDENGDNEGGNEQGGMGDMD
jgi:uncharacterized protein (TIGR03118 family)